MRRAHINELVQRFESQSNNRNGRTEPSSKFSENYGCKVPGTLTSATMIDRHDLKQVQAQRQRNDSIVSNFSLSSDSEFEPSSSSMFVKSDKVTETVSPEKIDVMLLSSRASAIYEMVARLPLPRLSATGMGVCFLIGIFMMPRACCTSILFPGFRLLFGNLYPAYASYKAVRTKNVKEYVKWMMYWIVFAFFSCIETFTDIFLAWFPFYYEVKVIIVLWLLSPATKGSSTLYRKFVHPMLTKRENEIDEYITQAKERGYTAVLQLGSKGVNYATSVIMQTAIKTISNTGIPVSRSDQSISTMVVNQPMMAVDQVDSDGEVSRMRRSRSYDSALVQPQTRYQLRQTPDVIYEGSSEDEELFIDDAGSARSRELPARKPVAKAPVAKKTTARKAVGGNIRGRRKIKEETTPAEFMELDHEILVE